MTIQIQTRAVARTHTRDRLLDLIERTYAAWRAALDEFSPERLEEPFMGEWSARDVIYHVTWFEREMLPILRERAFRASPWWELHWETRNRLILEEGRLLDPAEVLAEHCRVHRELLTELARLDDADLNDPLRIKGLPRGWTLWTVLDGNTFGHYQEHTPAQRM